MLCRLRYSTLEASNSLRAAPVVLQRTVLANRLQAGFWLKILYRHLQGPY